MHLSTEKILLQHADCIDLLKDHIVYSVLYSIATHLSDSGGSHNGTPVPLYI